MGGAAGWGPAERGAAGSGPAERGAVGSEPVGGAVGSEPALGGAVGSGPAQCGVHDRPERTGCPAHRPGVGRQRHVRRLPGRTPRSCGPAVPLPVHQLHELWPKVHHRDRCALRPAQYDDGPLRHVRAVRGGVPRPGRPQVPRAAGLLPRLRAPAQPALRRRQRAGGRRPAGRSGRAAAGRAGAGREGTRRLPPGRGCAQRGGGRGAAGAQAPGGQAVRGDGGRPGSGNGTGRGGRARGDAAGQPTPADRAAAAAAGHGRRGGRAGEPGAGCHAAVHPAAPPAARSGRRPDRADQRQSLRRAHRLPRRGCLRPAGGDRGRVPHPRQGHPHQDRRLGGAGGTEPGDAHPALPGLRTRAGHHGAPVPAPRAGLRRRAEEHVLPGVGRPRVRIPPHRGPGERGDAALVHRGHRALRPAVRHRPAGRRLRPAPGVPVHQVRSRPRHGLLRRAAPSRAHRLLPGRQRP